MLTILKNNGGKPIALKEIKDELYEITLEQLNAIIDEAFEAGRRSNLVISTPSPHNPNTGDDGWTTPYYPYKITCDSQSVDEYKNSHINFTYGGTVNE